MANVSLLIAALVYMGWAYENAEYGYFHVNPIDLNVSIAEYVLRSLNLFSPVFVIAGVVVIAISTVSILGLNSTMPVPGAVRGVVGRVSVAIARRRHLAHGIGRLSVGQLVLIMTAGIVTIAALILYFSHIIIGSYAYLAIFGLGPLLFTWPTRSWRHGHAAYALALLVAAICGLWAASLYAQGLGLRRAEDLVHQSTGLGVVIYSIQPLDISGPGITVTKLAAESLYHYRYQGLRLLTARAGTYYLFPARWNTQQGITYILVASDGIRIELH